MKTPPNPTAAQPERPSGSKSGAARSISSQEILAGRREAIIQHGEDEYRLRLTSSDKLILTK